MAYVIEGTTQGFGPQLDYFEPAQTETGILERYYKEIKSSGILSPYSVLEFNINNDSPDFIDPSGIQMMLEYQIMNDEGVACTANDTCGPINMPIATFFNQVDFCLEQKNISLSVGANYGYKAIIDTLLNRGMEARMSFMEIAGFYKDTPEYMEDTTCRRNLGLRSRMQLTQNKKTAKLYSPLFVDFLKQKKFLLNGIKSNIKFHPAPDKFRLNWESPISEQPTNKPVSGTEGKNEDPVSKTTLDPSGSGTSGSGSGSGSSSGSGSGSGSGTGSATSSGSGSGSGSGTTSEPATTPSVKPKKSEYFKLKYLDASLYVPFIKVHPGFLVEMSEKMKTKPVIYESERSEIKAFSVPGGNFQFVTEDIFNDSIPKKLIIGMVSGRSYAGDNQTNPFNFQHFNASDMAFQVNGMSTNLPLQMNFDTDHFYKAYASIFESLPPSLQEIPDIALDEFKSGYTLFVYDLEKTKEPGIKNTFSKGSSRLSIRFKKGLEESVVVIIYGIFDSLINIDQARNVIIHNG